MHLRITLRNIYFVHRHKVYPVPQYKISVFFPIYPIYGVTNDKYSHVLFHGLQYIQGKTTLVVLRFHALCLSTVVSLLLPGGRRLLQSDFLLLLSSALIASSLPTRTTELEVGRPTSHDKTYDVLAYNSMMKLTTSS